MKLPDWRPLAYTVVTADDSTLLSNKVNLLLREGWSLQGGVSVSQMEREDGCYPVLFAQAMTRVAP